VVPPTADSAHSPREIVVSLGGIGGQHRQAVARGSVFSNFGGSRTSQMLVELILQFSVLNYCSSERGKKGRKKK
jgi:hypothetical protein